MNILLLNPPPNDRSWYRVEHLGIAYIGAALNKAGHKVTLIDSLLENFDIAQTCNAILSRNEHIDILGITATEPETIKSGIEIVKCLNKKGLYPHVTAGGYFPTFWRNEIFDFYPEINSVVVGEGEETIIGLAHALENKIDLCQVDGLVYRNYDGKIVHNKLRLLIQDLDKIPFPIRDYLPLANKKYHHAVISSSRGCYYQCSFCQITQFYRLAPGIPYRTRSAKSIAEELELLINEYGVRSVFFVDDEFITKNPERRQVILDLIKEIKKRRLSFSFSIQYRADTGDDPELLSELKSVGLSTVFIGVESGVPSILKRFEKGINKTQINSALKIVTDLDLNLIAGYMFFDPNTSFDELKESIGYLLHPDAPFIQDFHGMNLLKGTIEEQRLRTTDIYLERDMKISYRILDDKVRYFAKAIRDYYPIYRKVVLDLYELLFMLVCLPEDIASDKKKIDKEVHALHKHFMSIAINEIDKGIFDENKLLTDLQKEFLRLERETQQLVDRAKRISS